MTARVILLYHRVSDASDPFTLTVSPERFEQQLSYLRKSADVVPLGELTGRKRRTWSVRSLVALTFDDGYADNLWNALPVLETYDMPATIFVTSRALGSPDGFWWDRLAVALVGRSDVELDLEIARRRVRFCLHDKSAGLTALWTLHRRLRPLPTAEIEHVLGEVLRQLGCAPRSRSAAAVVSKEDLHQLAAHPLVDIGAHTTDHALLRSQSPEAQERTIVTSKQDLENLIGHPVLQFAYPFGGLDSFDQTTVAAVRSAGFEAACSTLDGSLSPWSNRFYLPRRMVQNWNVDEYSHRLHSWGIG